MARKPSVSVKPKAKKAPKKLRPESKDGRPYAITDLHQLESLMRLRPTLADTANFFRCSEGTVEQTIRREYDLTFREFRDQRAVHTRLSVIRKAIQKAEAGDNCMLIFTLKNLCDWKDTQQRELSGPNGGPIEGAPIRINVNLPANGYEAPQVEAPKQETGE